MDGMYKRLMVYTEYLKKLEKKQSNKGLNGLFFYLY